MFIKRLSRFLAVSFAALLSTSSLATPSVITNIGAIEGVSSNGVEVFKGIPFAKAPEGDLRFAPPVKADAFAAPFKANTFCQIPYQSSFSNYAAMPGSGKNSLCLNIYRPRNANENSKLPVYVWIYGGAYVLGAGSIPLYDGTSFAKDGVILVTFNYRLGAEGFFSSKTTYKKYGTTGNWGHLDMIMALDWVNSHIAAFGGDNKNITVGGESAGAYATSALILSPLAKGKFQKAILQSGTIINKPIVEFDGSTNRNLAMSRSSTLATLFGSEDSDEGLALLRSIDPILLSYQCGFDYDFVHNKGSFLPPFLDGKVLPLSPYQALKDDEYNPVDVLLGYNTDEGTLFTDPNIIKEEFYEGLDSNYDKNTALVLKDLYKVDDKHTAYQRSSEYMSDMMFTLGMKAFADKLSQKQNVYMYHFDYATKNDLSFGTGVRHGSEIKYAFDNLSNESSNEQKDIAKITHMRFVNFIKTGDPNSDGSNKTFLTWPKYDTKDKAVFKINTLSGIEKFNLFDKLEMLEKEIFKDE